MTITRDQNLTPGVNHVNITLTSGKLTKTLRTTYNAEQEDFCIRRTARRLGMDKIDHVKIYKI